MEISQQKLGWILKLGTKKRNGMFVVPCAKYFRIAFTFEEKASDLIFNSELPKSIKKALFKAKKQAEGQTIQISDLSNILEMIRIKLVN